MMNLTKTKPDGASPMTPWIIAKQGSGLDVKVLVGWVPYKGSNYYNLLLDGISAYSGPEHKVPVKQFTRGPMLSCPSRSICQNWCNRSKSSR